jgi:hypothetical protein
MNTFAVLARGWRLQGKDARDLRVRVAGRFCRIAYQMVAGRMTFRHRCARQRDSVLKKLIRFALERGTASDQLTRDLDAAVSQLPVDGQPAAKAAREPTGGLRSRRAHWVAPHIAYPETRRSLSDKLSARATYVRASRRESRRTTLAYPGLNRHRLEAGASTADRATA